MIDSKENKRNSRTILATGSLLLLVWSVLFIGGLIRYSGSALTYILFSFTFLAMLVSGLVRQAGYGYLFLTIMLWLGFWLKVTVHLLLDYPYRESIGLFDGSSLAWDEVLRIATIGAIGVLGARLLYLLIDPKHLSSALQARAKEFPIFPWYSAWLRQLWAGMILLCIGVAILNASLGILQVGLVPRTILPWPLNAVISWLMGYGLALGIATLLWWDVILGRKVSVTVYSVLIEASFSTVSVLSRGTYVFHSIPQFFALFKNKHLVVGWSKRNMLLLGGAFVVLFALSNPFVNMLRSHYYSNVPLGSTSYSNVPLGSTSTGLNGITVLLVDRWIGAEGLMVVEAHPGKGSELFWKGMQEHRAIGKDTLYVEMSRPIYYGVIDKTKFEFSEIPGAMAFFYYSGRPWAVLMGMFLLTTIVLGSEILVSKGTRNPILCALWGGMAANLVAQMGVAPRGTLIPVLETTIAITAIGFIQSRHFARLIWHGVAADMTLHKK